MVWYAIFKNITGIMDKLLLKLGYKSHDGTIAGVVVNIGTINFPNTGANLIIVGMLTVIIIQQRIQMKQDQKNGGKKEKKKQESPKKNPKKNETNLPGENPKKTKEQDQQRSQDKKENKQSQIVDAIPTTKPTGSTSQEQNQDKNKGTEISETDKTQERGKPKETPLKREEHKLGNQQQDKLINQEKNQDKQPHTTDEISATQLTGKTSQEQKQELNTTLKDGNQNKEKEISQTVPTFTKEERNATLLLMRGLLRGVDFFLNVGFPAADLQNDKNVTENCEEEQDSHK